MKTIKNFLDQHPALKRLVHGLIVPKGDACPRKWIRLTLSLFHPIKGKIRGNARMDVFPFQSFVLAKNAIIEDFATINNGVGKVEIGSRSRIGIGSVVIGPAYIGNDCLLAQNVVISGLNHGFEDVQQPITQQGVTTQKVTIHNSCWIGANVSITAGVTLGKHAVIGAGSVVTKDIPPYSVAVGNPARVIKQYDFEKKEWVKVKPQSKTRSINDFPDFDNELLLVS